MPKNSRKTFALSADFVELLHDEVVPAYLPGHTPVQKMQIRDRGLLESACARPFQTAFGSDGHPTILDKAAVLFHGLIANHPFHDGNKRTAVIALDAFLAANDYLLSLLPEEMYELAIETASARLHVVTPDQSLANILKVLIKWAVPFATLGMEADLTDFYQLQIKKRDLIRGHDLNR